MLYSAENGLSKRKELSIHESRGRGNVTMTARIYLEFRWDPLEEDKIYHPDPVEPRYQTPKGHK